MSNWKSMVGKGVVWFAKEKCPNCSKAGDLLSKIGVKNDRINVDKWNTEDIKKMQTESEHMTFPNIYLNNMHIGGYERLENMYSSRKLYHILKQEGISYREDTERN